MEKLYTILDLDGKVLFAKYGNDVLFGQIAIDTLLTIPMDNPYWDFDNEIFYDKVITI